MGQGEIYTQNVATLERVREQNLAVHLNSNPSSMSTPGADRTGSREVESYDVSYYETQLVKAVGSVLSPLRSTRHSKGNFGYTPSPRHRCVKPWEEGEEMRRKRWKKAHEVINT